MSIENDKVKDLFKQQIVSTRVVTRAKQTNRQFMSPSDIQKLKNPLVGPQTYQSLQEIYSENTIQLMKNDRKFYIDDVIRSSNRLLSPTTYSPKQIKNRVIISPQYYYDRKTKVSTHQNQTVDLPFLTQRTTFITPVQKLYQLNRFQQVNHKKESYHLAPNIYNIKRQ